MNNLYFEKIINFIVEKSHFVELIFAILVFISVICYPFVGVNYDLSKYLPEFAPSKQALEVMEDEFGYPGMARIMVEDVSLYEAGRIKDKIQEVEGVDLVLGVNTLSDIYMSKSFIDDSDIDTFYKDGNAVMEVIFKGGESDPETHEAIDKIQEIIGDRGYYTGSAVSKKSIQESVSKELKIAIVISFVIIFMILTITTISWFEPFLFIFVMAVAIIINMGSNIIFGRISFFTFSTAAILQLAVSMDYSIFLLDTFSMYRKQGIEVKESLKLAIKRSVSSILASGATTIVGFLVLIVMEFTIGKDMGLVLSKGILTSLLTVLFLMPALILRNYSKVEKYYHKPLIPELTSVGDRMYKIRKVVLILAVLTAVPCYFGQNMNTFKYGDAAIGAGPGTKFYEDTKKIEDTFGKSNMLLAIVPNTSNIREKELANTLDDYDFVNYALSLSSVLPDGIPEDFLPSSIVEQMHTENYARIIMSLDTIEESDYAFDCVDKIQKTVHDFYEGGYVLGMTTSTLDVKNILTEDYSRVSILSLIGVVIVVMCTFRSWLIPIIVIIPIEVAIYLNMTIPYLIGGTMTYIGYIIVSCLQLGATIDYSILVTNNYLHARQSMNKIEAAKKATSQSALSVITSGSILTVVGYGLFLTSSVQGIWLQEEQS